MPYEAGNITWPLPDLSDCQVKRLRERACKGAKRPPRLPTGQSADITNQTESAFSLLLLFEGRMVTLKR